MSKSKKNKEKEKEEKIFYLRASSLEDICRYACRFDFNSETLLLSGNKLIAFGERIGAVLIAYHTNSSGAGNVIMYEPSTNGGKERATFTTKTDLTNRYYINVVRADLGKLEAAKGIDKKEVQMVKMENGMDLIGAAIRKAAKEEAIANIYSFSQGGKTILAAFDVLEALSNGKPIFYYCAASSKPLGNFARYDYRNNVLDFTNTIGDHAYMYAKIISLAEPFPFFK